MGEIIGLAIIFGTVLTVLVLKSGDPLNDPRVEWRVMEGISSSGGRVWNWTVQVDGGQREQHHDYSQYDAKHHARVAARVGLGRGRSIGKTRPCPLCGKPSRVGKETDTDGCARLLTSARAELPKAVL